MSDRKPIFAANWKMNLKISDAQPFCSQLAKELDGQPSQAGTDYDVMIAPPATHLGALGQAMATTPWKLGAQNCGPKDFGAFTGELAPPVLKELNCHWVILGHSERRHIFQEDDSLILRRFQAAQEQGLHIMLCVGETLDQRKAQKTWQTVERQLSILKEVPPQFFTNIAIAYEPVWAIGTGEVASPAQAQEIHAKIRTWLTDTLSEEHGPKFRILYGGSVKPENAQDLLREPDVDGFLVGGASLDATKFAKVILNGLVSRAA